MDTSQRTQRGRRPALAAAVLAVCAFGSVPAFAQLPIGSEITVPPLVSEGTEGSTPDPTTTTTSPPPPSTAPTAPPTAPGPEPGPAPAVPSATTSNGPSGSTETARRATSSGRRASARATAPSTEETFDVAPAAADQAPAITRLRQVTLPAARQFGFPLGLAVLVLAFLAVQGRLDARDPKLVAASLSVDDDLLPFT